jgi:hypothetical protein
MKAPGDFRRGFHLIKGGHKDLPICGGVEGNEDRIPTRPVHQDYLHADHVQAVQNQTADRYLSDLLSPAEREEFEAHYFECEVCADEVWLGQTFAANLRAVFREQEFQALLNNPDKARDLLWEIQAKLDEVWEYKEFRDEAEFLGLPKTRFTPPTSTMSLREIRRSS